MGGNSHARIVHKKLNQFEMGDDDSSIPFKLQEKWTMIKHKNVKPKKYVVVYRTPDNISKCYGVFYSEFAAIRFLKFSGIEQEKCEFVEVIK